MTLASVGDDAVRTASRLTSANPFSTRYTRPGAVPPLDASGRPLDIGPLLDRIGCGCWAIEGPHGRGKTTLVRALLATAASAGHTTSFSQVRSWADAWPTLKSVVRAGPGHIVAVDGWEQLPWGVGLVIVAVARWRRTTVIATAHGPIGLPVLAHRESSPALVAAIIERLPDHHGTISAADVEQAFRCHRGNVRDALATLYDRFEERRP
jgi:hypothetical protein